ncbi:MAG: flavodoxin reductase [Bacteroidia bacterium]
MVEHIVKIIKISSITHDVKQFVVERPAGYAFVPGQATEVSINSPEWKDKKNPFTFTGLEDSPHLQFTIKIYTDHNGVTNELNKLKEGDELIVHDVWGAISYKGPGVFIAGGAGITPFIAILRKLKRSNSISGNKLIFSNKTRNDVILEQELTEMLGADFINVFTREKVTGVKSGRIDKGFLRETVKDFNQHFYLCGPDAFVASIQQMLMDLGAHADSVVFEK